MDNDLGAAVNRFYRIVAGIDQRGEISHAGRGLAVLPQHTIVRLVAHLDPLGRHTVRFKGVQHIVGMIVNRCFECGEALAGPGGRFGLAARICPRVAVVEIDHNAEAHIFGAYSLFNHICFVGEINRRIDPDPQTDGVHPVIFEDLQQILLHTAVIVERPIIILHFRQPADIRPFGKSGRRVRRLGDGEIEHKAEQKRQTEHQLH
ncbi:hypothetical protein D3C73_1024480 [compost metagenome]